MEGGCGFGERRPMGTPHALGKSGELKTRAPSSGLRRGRNGGVSVRSEPPSRAPPGRTLLRHHWLFQHRGFPLAKPRCTPGYASFAPPGRGRARGGRSLAGADGEGRAHCPNAQRGGAGGRTKLGWGERHHSESDEYCTGAGDRRPRGSRCDGVSPSGFGGDLTGRVAR